MYFPFLHGRRAELLALRSVLTSRKTLDALIPVIEPVKRKVSDLERCIDAFGSAQRSLAVIINPDKLELKAPDDVRPWMQEISAVIDGHDSILPTFICGPSTGVGRIESFLKRFEGREVAIAYSSPTLSDAETGWLASQPFVRFNLVLNSKMTAAAQQLLPFGTRVAIRDHFNKLDRNADYGAAELFTDRHKTFKHAWAGFGDYTTIGSAFAAGGGQPAAVAIHAIYKYAFGDVYIEHFVSDDIDLATGDAASKFLQAAAKLVDAATKRPAEFGSNRALAQYAACVADKHFPGLGTNKSLQIEHHILTMLDILSGDL